MTRRFNAETTQTGFLGWVRNNPTLDSVAASLVVQDSDFWVHRYKSVDGKQTQFLMLVELKEFGGRLTDSQRDTLHIINQLLRNRRNTRAEWNALESTPRISQCSSLANGGRVNVICFGAHLLRLSGDGTFAQWSRIEWDNKVIDLQTLEGLLRFDIDPDTLGKLDHRPESRHKTTEIVSTITTPLGFEAEQLVVRKS